MLTCSFEQDIDGQTTEFQHQSLNFGLADESPMLKNGIEDYLCDGFSHVVSNKSTMQVNRKTSYFCMQDKEPLLLRGHPRAGR
jgi:hypothetical protein